ncbi:L,D-transpeptidase [Chelatococcus composti]|jgi:lipoprotein-anchoring transpeptidase ErfK/SrfK|uniref:Lipoprotein-anchoring transpeptidase ErfK/SrfK n=1 Tax=Chelatococcus composti TaxID=1743235 RepID=A0A841KH67_9HYPH|nr:L,D-transpeptidase [Chelatococcus composti]MBB6168589.1 lipoprotein-anchoring transpeptidase ErfK/SrfK [Chelatococcus composti]GGG41194.1 L,D-transpeptidase [Chelatococcus composti]
MLPRFRLSPLAAMLACGLALPAGSAGAQTVIYGTSTRAPLPTVRVIQAPRPQEMAAATRQQVRQTNLGGGFIELLVTGRTPTAASRSLQPARATAPSSAGAARLYAVPPVDPLDAALGNAPSPERRPSRNVRHAALPDATELQPARAPEPRYARQVVDYKGPHKPGTVVVDTANRFLYLVQPGGRAIRYGIGVGRQGFSWRGTQHISMKREWPDWRPPAQMLKRRPDLPRYMPGGPNNPLGARALYLGNTLYRIHGTNEPHTIGRAVSSGCIRMLNKDVIDLYNRVRIGTKVVVT